MRPPNEFPNYKRGAEHAKYNRLKGNGGVFPERKLGMRVLP